MGKRIAQQKFESLQAEALRRLRGPYMRALAKIIKGEDAVDEWREFAVLWGKASVLSNLIGRKDGISQLRRTGFRLKDNGERVIKGDAREFVDDRTILGGAFENAVNEVGFGIPGLRELIDGLVGKAKASALFIAGVESRETIGRIRDWMAKILEGDKIVGIRDFVDFAQNDQLVALSEARLENVYRTNMQTTLNAGKFDMLNNSEVSSETALWVLDEVQDNRTRGNPSGRYPGAGPHFQMDGFMEKPNHAVWSVIWPPNGYQCRATVNPMSWFTARQRGFATEGNDLIQSSIDDANGSRWDFIKSRQYPDDGFAGGPGFASLAG